MKAKKAALSTASTVDCLTPALAWTVALENAMLRAIDKYPSDIERIKSGRDLITQGHVTIHATTHAEVRSSRPETGKTYTVNGSCQCEATGWAKYRGDEHYRCSHKWAKALYLRALILLEKMSTATYQADPRNPESVDVYGFLHALPEASGFAFQYEGGFRVVLPNDARLVTHARCAWVEDGQYVGYVPEAAKAGILASIGIADFSHLVKG